MEVRVEVNCFGKFDENVFKLFLVDFDCRSEAPLSWVS